MLRHVHITIGDLMKVTIDLGFAKGYCEKKDCMFLFQPMGRYKIQGKVKSWFCKKPELLKEHIEEHFKAGGKGVAKIVRGEEETYVLKSNAKHFVTQGRAEVVSETPYIVKLPEN